MIYVISTIRVIKGVSLHVRRLVDSVHAGLSFVNLSKEEEVVHNMISNYLKCRRHNEEIMNDKKHKFLGLLNW
jgi:hypothetical protein